MRGLLPWRRTRSREVAQATELEPLVRLRDEIQGLLGEFASRFSLPAEFGLTWQFGTDVRDEGDRVVVSIEAPGFDPEEFDVRISGNLLTVRAKHSEETGKPEAGRYYRRYGVVHRVITLPPGVDVDKAEAHYNKGILEVVVPKLPEEARGKKVPVKAV